MSTGDIPQESSSSGSSSGSSPNDLLASGVLAGAWQLDAARTSVTLRSKSVWGLVSVRGRFTEVSGNGVVTPGGTVNGQVVIDAKSVDTHNAKRDQHLRSAEFFNVDEHPTITFTVTAYAPPSATRSRWWAS